MKTKVYILFIIFFSIELFGQNPITPNGKEINAFTRSDLSQDDINYINSEIANNYPGVITIQSPQPYFGTFNCHFFAWHNNQGYTIWNSSGNLWQKGTPPEYKWFNSPSDYFSDAGYSNPSGYTSYVQTTESTAPISVYKLGGAITHSARNLAGSNELISKWGQMGVYQHAPTEVPVTYGSITEKYKINPNYRPVGTGDPGGRNWGTINNAFSGLALNGAVIVYPGIHTLFANINVSSGTTFLLNPGSTINLNSYSVISTGGTINKQSGATISGLAAYITETGIIKGLCPTIQSALTNAPSSGCFVEIQPGTYSENVSVSNKSYLIITGDELNTNLTGNMSFYSCPDLEIHAIKSKNVTLSNCSSPNIYHDVNGSGTGGGVNLFSCTDFQRMGEASNAAYGLTANSGNGYIYQSASFYNNNVAVNSSNSSEIISMYSQICGNVTTDLYAITGGYIYAYECYYNNATPRIYEYLNGNVDVNGVRECGLMKRGTETEFPVSIIPENLNTDDPAEREYLTLQNEHYKLFRKIKDDIKLQGNFQKDKFRNEHISIIKSYKAFLKKYPGSSFARNAMVTSAKSFWRYDDYSRMKEFLDDIIADKKTSSLKGLAENYIVDYYRDIKDFDKAIKQADYIAEEYGYDDNLVCGAMYNKALMLAHDLNKPEEAVACLRNIIKNYPENDLK